MSADKSNVEQSDKNMSGGRLWKKLNIFGNMHLRLGRVGFEENLSEVLDQASEHITTKWIERREVIT